MTKREVDTQRLAAMIDVMAPAERALFDAAVAAAAERQAVRWRFRLIAIETVMLTMLVLVSGLLVGQPQGMVIRASLTVGMACLLTGLLLIWLSGLTSRLMLRWRQRRAAS